ncbi:MAG: AbgT family transporter [Pseudomonadales bacterium]
MSQHHIITNTLQRIETLGNKLPHPTLLFIYLCGFILLLSAISSGLGIQATHPLSGETITSVNLISRAGLHRILEHTVTNFTHFAPVGSVLVAIMGIGVAEHSGLIAAALRATVLKAPPKLLSFIVVLTGVLSSLAMDTGYVVLIPLAALVFISAGRHPVAGIAAAFAGVSGGFSANVLIGPVDAILGGISTEAAALVQADYEVSAAANYYFIIVSTLLISVIGTWVTEKIVVPRLGDYPSNQDHQSNQPTDAKEHYALRAVAVFSIAFIALLLWGLLPEDGLLRDAEGGILRSPFIKGIVIIIAFYAAIAGLIYGKCSGSFSKRDDFIKGMESSMGTMATYLVLMFFAAQFVSYFNWSQLGAISAINGADLLKSLALGPTTLLISFIIMAALINLLIGSASAKWALFAPIFVPMFLLVGISPEATQIAYRIGDSSTNIITPLMPYFGVVVAFVQRYDKKAGIGTIIATMLPYSLAFLISWSALLVLWILMDWPLGPGAQIFML